MSEFYNLPSGVVKALKENHEGLNGKILAPYDPLHLLTDNLKKDGLQITVNENEENLYDSIWWSSLQTQDFSWTAAVTIGSNDYNQYILEYGLQIAQKGLIVLDRLSFLEPATKRRRFLQENPLTKMIVLSPRPKFRAIGSTRDSVTACWFIFEKNRPNQGTEIVYALDWDAVKPLTPLT